jgi:hypothetical protein
MTSLETLAGAPAADLRLARERAAGALAERLGYRELRWVEPGEARQAANAERQAFEVRSEHAA